MRFVPFFLQIAFYSYGQQAFDSNHVCNDSATFFVQRVKSYMDEGKIPLQAKIRDLDTVILFDNHCREAIYLRNQLKRNYYAMADKEMLDVQKSMAQYPSDPDLYVHMALSFERKKGHNQFY